MVDRRENLPDLVTSGSASDPVPAALGQPNTTVLFGPADENIAWRSGVRVNFVLGTDYDTGWDADGSAFVLFHHTNTYNFAGNGSAGSAVLAQPFFNVATGTEDAAPFAVPNSTSGAVESPPPASSMGPTSTPVTITGPATTSASPCWRAFASSRWTRR